MTDAADHPALLGALEENIVAFISAPQRRPWAEVGHEEDVSWLRTGLPWAWCNGVAGTRFDEATAEERIEAVLAPYRERQIRLTWFLGPTTTPTDLLERLTSHGLEANPLEPGMVCELSGWSVPPVPADLTVERVADMAAFHEWCEVFVGGMEVPGNGQSAFEELFVEISVGKQSPIRTYLARRDGKAIACGFGVLSRGAVGIYAVATLPEARRQGAGGAVTAGIMDDARGDGARIAVLESSEMGFPLYERLGFRTICEMGSATGTPS